MPLKKSNIILIILKSVPLFSYGGFVTFCPFVTDAEVKFLATKIFQLEKAGYLYQFLPSCALEQVKPFGEISLIASNLVWLSLSLLKKGHYFFKAAYI